MPAPPLPALNCRNRHRDTINFADCDDFAYGSGGGRPIFLNEGAGEAAAPPS